MTRTPTLILVHGSFMGGWVWRPLVRELQALGIQAEAPTLSGMGDRGHAGGGGNGLHAHAADIAAFLEFVDHDEVVLVGHSYGCAVAAEAAALRPDLVDHLLLIDGFVLPAGRSIFDEHPELAGMFGSLERQAGDADMLLPPPFDPFGMPPGAETDRFLSLHRPMSIRTHQEQARGNVDHLACRKSYLRFGGFPFFKPAYDKAKVRGWQVAELAEPGHMGVATHPAEVARVLQKLSCEVEQ